MGVFEILRRFSGSNGDHGVRIQMDTGSRVSIDPRDAALALRLMKDASVDLNAGFDGAAVGKMQVAEKLLRGELAIRGSNSSGNALSSGVNLNANDLREIAQNEAREMTEARIELTGDWTQGGVRSVSRWGTDGTDPNDWLT